MACGILSAPLSVKIHTMNTIMKSARRSARLAVTITIAVLAGLAMTPSAWSLEVSGVRVDERVKLANTDLLLNGAGIRYAAAGFVRVYVAALYQIGRAHV